MAEEKRLRQKVSGFVGLQLTPDLLKRLDDEVKKTTLNRSQVVRLALIDYLDKKDNE